MVASKIEAVKSSLLDKSFSNKKILTDLLPKTFNFGITNLQGFIDQWNFYL